MRQDLMRQQALEEEQKEAQRQQEQLLRSTGSLSSPISVSGSSSCGPPAQVPVEVLKVQRETLNGPHARNAKSELVPLFLLMLHVLLFCSETRSVFLS